MWYRYLLIISLLAGASSLKAQQQEYVLIDQAIHALNETLINDITSPPVASRDYYYSFLAMYEAARSADPAYPGFAGKLNGLKALPTPPKEPMDPLVAALSAFEYCARAMVFSKALFSDNYAPVVAALKNRPVDAEVVSKSSDYGVLVAKAILHWADADGFAKTRTMQRFTVSKTPGSWQQTAPDFMEAVEPYWNTLRPAVLPSLEAFRISPPAVFNSPRFKDECREVYEKVNTLTAEEKAIASFWDCNPFATQTVGHLMYSVKKISPAGHWVGIAGQAMKQHHAPLIKGLYTYALLSIGIYDAVITAWDEKYRSNYIRPETAIQQAISPTWLPFLQTPPFPEYPSGHSVISMASATILTRLYGENQSYTDSTELEYGLPRRNFQSFYQAANEAAISRLYGGIHFREAIENGILMGRKVGEFVLSQAAIHD
jgi:hypothetical protein